MRSSARKFAADVVVSDNDILAAFSRAPVDDRPETEEERAAVDAAKAAARAPGKMVPHDEVVAAIERWRSAG